MTKRFSVATRLLSATATLVLASSLSAQTAAPPDHPTAEPAAIAEIVVTAERRSQNVQAVPVTIAAFSGSQLADRGVERIEDLARLVPSVNFGTFGYGTQIAARGVGMNLIGGEGESSVALQVDGIPLTRPSMQQLVQNDIGRVEFLLGPQGTLYGRNATAGVLNIISPAPPKDIEAGATVGYGNYNAVVANAAIGGPLSDHIRARAYVGYNRRDGFIQNTVTGQKLDDVDSLFGRLSVDADLGEDFTLETRAFGQRSRTANPVYKPIEPVAGFPPSSYDLNPYRIASDKIYRSSRDLIGASAKLSWHLTDHDTIASLSGYVHYRDIANYDADGTSLNLFDNTRRQYVDQFTEELTYLHDGERTKLTLGAFYFNETITDRKLIVRTPSFTPVNGLQALLFPNHKHNSNISGFGDLTYAATERLSVFGGVRVINDRRAQDQTDALDFGPGAVVDLCSANDASGQERSNKTVVTGRLGGRYEVDAASSIYASVSRGYKSGGFNSGACQNPFGSEELNAAEIGTKNLFLDRRLLINASAFYYDFHNLQVEQVIATDAVIDNVPKSEIYGLDLQLSYKANARLTIDGGLSLLHARYVRFNYLDTLNPGLGNQDLSGKPLNRSPDASGNVGVEYAAPLGTGTLTPRVDIYGTTRFALRPANQSADFQGGYATVAASLTWRDKDDHYRVRVWGKNLTDHAVLQGVFAIDLFGLGREGIYAAPRTFGADLTWRF